MIDGGAQTASPSIRCCKREQGRNEVDYEIRFELGCVIPRLNVREYMPLSRAEKAPGIILSD
jgi:hypothetical protein